MPNPIQPQEVINFEGIIADAKKARAAISDWIEEDIKLFGELETASNRIKDSFARIKKEVAGIKDLDSFNDYHKKIGDLSATLANQQKAMAGLKATEQELSSTQQSLSQRTEELMKRYAALNGTSAKVVSEKKKIATELVSLQSQFERLNKIVALSKPTLASTGKTYNSLAKQTADWKAELLDLDDAFTKSGGINRFNAKAIELRSNILKGEAALRKMDAAMGSIGDGSNLKVKGIDRVPGEAGVTSSVGRIAKSFFALEVAREVGEAVLDFGKDVLETTAKFEKYNAVLETTLGSTEAGAAAFNLVQRTAAKTNFGVDELTDSYIKLANRGIRPGEDALINLSDVANATGKPFGQLVEAINDVNNTDRWNEIGIKAKTAGDKVSLTFKGTTKEVDRTEAGVYSAILAFGKMDGVVGGTAKISATLDGQLSNLGDNFDQLKTTIGGDSKGFFALLIASANELLVLFRDIFIGTKPLRDGFGEIVEVFDQLFTSVGTLIRGFFNYDEKAKASQIITDALVFGFRIVGTVLLALVGNINLAVDAFNVLLDSGKRVANFFGAGFEVNSNASLATLRKNVDANGKAIVSLWKDTAKGVQDASKKMGVVPPAPKAPKPPVDAKKAQQDADKRLKDSIDKEKALNKDRLAALELIYKQGNLNEAQYIDERAQLEQAGVFKIQKLLKAAGKQKTADFIETETQLKEIASKNADERNKIEEKAWKESVDTVKNALKAIDDAAAGDLGGKIADLDKANLKAEGDIQRRIASRKISEEQGQQELYDLRVKYLAKLAKLTEDSIAENEKQSLEAIEKLRKAGLTEAQIKEITALRAAEIGQKALDVQKAQTDASVKITEVGEQKKTAIAEVEAEKRKAINDKLWELAGQAVASYFEITSAFREKDLANLDKQKEHELELAGDNDEAKKQIELRYAERQKELRKRQAKADRASAAFSIILNTALGASSALSKVVTAPLVPFIIALGALQLATVLAKPIPEFFKGKTDSYEGPGYVGDRGYEFVERKDPTTGRSSFEFAAQKQLTYLSKNDRVYTHEESKRMIQQHHQYADDIRIASPMSYQRQQGGSGYMPGEISKEVANGVRQAMDERPVQENHFDWQGYRQWERKQNQRTEYLNRRYSWPYKKH